MVHPKENNAKQVSIEESGTNDKPPILGSWKNIYLIVLLSLTATIILLYFFSKAFQ